MVVGLCQTNEGCASLVQFSQQLHSNNTLIYDMAKRNCSFNVIFLLAGKDRRLIIESQACRYMNKTAPFISSRQGLRNAVMIFTSSDSLPAIGDFYRIDISGLLIIGCILTFCHLALSGFPNFKNYQYKGMNYQFQNHKN